MADDYEFLKAQKDAMLARCSFCKTTKPEVTLLTGVVPVDARICSDCVAACVWALTDKLAGRKGPAELSSVSVANGKSVAVEGAPQQEGT